MDDILQDLGDPVACKGDESDQTDDLCPTATTGALTASGIASRLVLGVDGDQSHAEPSSKDCRNQASEKGDNVHVSEVSRDVNGGLQHHHAEWDSRDPADETDDREHAKQEKDDATTVVLL